MTDFDRWCDSEAKEAVGGQHLSLLKSNDDDLGADLVADLIPGQYAETKALAEIATRLGKEKVAAFLAAKIPKSQRARSGDLGEILASAYVGENLGFEVGPSRLIHRDHQEWAMRGDDVLAARFASSRKTGSKTKVVELVKVEAKSRASAYAAVVAEARAGLEREAGLPSAHSLTQFAERLLVGAHDELGEAILAVSLDSGVRPAMVTHLMFIFSGNDPREHIKGDLNSYSGGIRQRAVVVRVKKHQDFIRAVFTSVVGHA